ncbi:MAG: ABC transporter permease, partial [Firmicutes bacterium]|nr:ABC transporter permease [Bacillota bacterium]
MAIWSTLRELFRDYRFFFAFIALLFLVVLAVMSFFSPYDPTLWYYAPRDLKPSNQYILGTDSRGQDIFWQATFAIRNSLVISVVAGVISRIIALVVGLVAGYRGGRVDRFLMFVSDGFLVIPLFLIIVMLAMLIRDKMNNFTTGLLLAVFGWAWDARVIRSQVLSLREREFTKTAILSGTRTMELVFKEYMPYIT